MNKYLSISGLKIKINWGAIPYKEREIMSPYDQGKTLPGWFPKIDLKNGLKMLIKENHDT